MKAIDILKYCHHFICGSSTFLDEILQNAEDACARIETLGYIKINFDVNGIAIYHNNDPFNEADLIAITTYGKTTKNNYLILIKLVNLVLVFVRFLVLQIDQKYIQVSITLRSQILNYSSTLEPKAIPVGYTTYFWFPF